MSAGIKKLNFLKPSYTYQPFPSICVTRISVQEIDEVPMLHPCELSRPPCANHSCTVSDAWKTKGDQDTWDDLTHGAGIAPENNWVMQLLLRQKSDYLKWVTLSSDWVVMERLSQLRHCTSLRMWEMYDLVVDEKTNKSIDSTEVCDCAK